MTVTDIFSRVDQVMNEKMIKKADFARLLNLHSTSVNGMYNRKSISLARLVQASKKLNYNFFREIADNLNISEPQAINPNKELHQQYQKTIESQQETIHKLQTKIEVLEDLYDKVLKNLTKTGS